MAAIVLPLVFLVMGCGVPVQDDPAPLDVGALPPQTSSPQGGSSTVRVYLVRGDRLHEVVRAAPNRSAESAIERLAAGPTRREVSQGLRTALVPQPLTVTSDDSGTVVLGATADFAGVSGADQLLAVAQLVWTLTDVPGVDRLNFTIDGRPIEVPTDSGLRGDAVGRADYVSVEPTGPSAEPAPSPSGASP